MQYRDRTEDFNRLIDLATERARSDTALAEESIGRAGANLASAPIDMASNLMQGATRGYGEGLENQQRKVQTEGDRLRTAEEQRRADFINSNKADYEAAQKAELRRPITEQERWEKDFQQRDRANKISAQTASLNARLAEDQLLTSQNARRISQGAAIAQGIRRKQSREQDAYNYSKATASPFMLASMEQQRPQQQDIVDQLIAKDYSPDEALQIYGQVMPEGGTSALTQGAITDETTKVAPIYDKAAKFSAALDAFDQAKEVYRKEGAGNLFDSEAAKDSVEKIAQALDLAAGGEGKSGMAKQLRSGVWSRIGSSYFGGEKSALMSEILKDYSAKFKEQAQGEIVTQIRSLKPEVRAQPSVQSLLQEWQSGNIPSFSASSAEKIYTPDQVPAMTGQPGMQKVDMKTKKFNIFNKAMP